MWTMCGAQLCSKRAKNMRLMLHLIQTINHFAMASSAPSYGEVLYEVHGHVL